jgi:hypothetical protein
MDSPARSAKSPVPLAGLVSNNLGFRDPAIRNASGGYGTSDTVVVEPAPPRSRVFGEKSPLTI